MQALSSINLNAVLLSSIRADIKEKSTLRNFIISVHSKNLPFMDFSAAWAHNTFFFGRGICSFDIMPTPAHSLPNLDLFL